MSKYVYYNGKIYDSDIDTNKALAQCLAHFYDGKEFDKFEDLIEVGDLIKFYVENEKYERVEYYGTIDEFGFICRYSIGFNSRRFLEIWKRINNTFIRVCHKEINGEWVID